MHVPTPGWRVTFWLKCAGDDGVSVPCPFPLRVPGKPVNESGDHCRVGARLVSGDHVNCAHSVAHSDAPHTRRTHTHTHARMTQSDQSPEPARTGQAQALVVSRFSSGRKQPKKSHDHRRPGPFCSSRQSGCCHTSTCTEQMTRCTLQRCYD